MTAPQRQAATASGPDGTPTVVVPETGPWVRLATANVLWIFLILVALIVAFTAIQPNFVKPFNIRSIFADQSYLIVLAIGETFVIITAGIDLSVGAVLIFSGVIAGKMMLTLYSGHSAIGAMNASWGVIGVGVLAGVASGISVSKIASDNTKGGVLAADTLAKLTGGKGTVMVVNVNPGISTTDARDQGFKQEMSAKYPDVKVLPTQFGNDDQAKAAQILTATYAAHPDLNGIFAANTISAEGVGTGIKNANASGKIKIVGFDAEPQSIQDLNNDVVQALIAQQPGKIGSDGIDQAVNALEGKSVQATIGTDLVAITKDNQGSTSQYFYKSSC